MRPIIIAGNWKMNFTYSEGNQFISSLKTEINSLSLKNQHIYIFPPSLLVASAGSLLTDSPIHVGAQNCYSKQSGAYTGEISPEMIKSAGGDSVIIGHSERREYFHETNNDLNKKIHLAADTDLTVVYCVGEKLEERESGQVEQVIESQLREGLESCSDHFKNKKIIIAYEPVWAIGTGKVATPSQAEEVHLFIRQTLVSLFNDKIAEETPILYGGSVKPDNAQELLSQENIDGALIGGACLEVDSFVSIIKTTLEN